MFESIAGFLAALRQTSPVIFLGIAIATGTIIFSNEDFAAILGVDEFRKTYRGFIGGAFIAAISILGSYLLLGTYRFILKTAGEYRQAANKHRLKVQRIEQLFNLTRDEKAYLLPYIDGEETTLYFKQGDGVAQQLIAKKILFRAADVGSLLTGFAHNMHPWAREYLTDNPELLDGANPNPKGPPKY